MNLFYLDNLNIINIQARLFFESIHTPWLTNLMLVITDIGSPGSIALYSLVLIMLMWLHKKYAHLIQFIFTIGLTAIVAVCIKEITKIPRPIGGVITEIGYSFASAHTMIATVFFVLIIHSYQRHFTNRLIRVMFITTNIILIILVAVSRVYLGVHYATDVLAGLLSGLIFASLSILLYNKKTRTK